MQGHSYMTGDGTTDSAGPGHKYIAHVVVVLMGWPSWQASSASDDAPRTETQGGSSP
jgi:hypothetical protein